MKEKLYMLKEKFVIVVLVILATIIGFIPLEIYGVGWIYYSPSTFWQFFAYVIMGGVLAVVQLFIYFVWYLPYVSMKIYY